jgi:hypothetical protein
MASVIPKEAKLELTDRWKNEDLWVALFQATSNCTTDGISTYAACTNQCTGTNYTAGGILLDTPTSSLSGQDAILNATDSLWSACTLSQPAKYAVVYVKTGTTAGLIRGVFDFGTAATVTNGTLTIQWSNSGLIKVSSV